MDYAEEQRSELEAIEAIYPNEFSLISDDPISFSISVKSDNYDEENSCGLFCTLKFIFTSTYPEEVPEIDIVNEDDSDTSTNLEPKDVLDLNELLTQTANENTGMAMVFTLVTTASEWLNNRWDALLKEREEEAERKRIEEEENELKRFEGTRVTVQTFIAWKTAFEEEMAALKKKSSKEKDSDIAKQKLTGKELFLKDNTLIDSDLKFEEDGDAVPFDESLFEDIEDLELDDNT